MYLLEQMANHLAFLGFGTLPSESEQGTIFWGHMPDQPDACICVFSTDSGYAGSDGGARIQMAVRALTTRAAYELSQEIVETIADFEGYLAGDGDHVSIRVENASIGVGADEKRREIYTSNFRVYYCDY